MYSQQQKSLYTPGAQREESNLDNIVDQLCTRLQDIKDQQSASRTGMPTCPLEQTEAVRRYYAAFPPLKKGHESPLPYFLPPPAWCRKPIQDSKMQSDIIITPKDWNSKPKKIPTGKERRNSFHGQRKHTKKRCNNNNYSRSFEKERLPEWVTNEGVWDMETQDPVKEFIRALALDEGYGTCENTVTDELKEITDIKYKNDNMVPDWDDSLDLDTEWVITEEFLNPKVRTPVEQELYAKFEAKFDRSLEALWSKDQNTPDDEYQELPIDFQDLLSSPSDHMFADPSTEKCSLISLTESIWSNDDAYPPADRVESPSRIVDVLHDRFKPLNLTDVEPQFPPRELESFSLYEGEDIYDALSSVAHTMRSFTAINHSRDRSGFVEVIPRRNAVKKKVNFGTAIEPKPIVSPIRTPSAEREDLLTSARTHFRPIRREAETEPVRYVDGDTFDIDGELDEVKFTRSESGNMYLECSLERYLEYRSKSVDYRRLNLTEAQKCPEMEDNGFKLRFAVRQLDVSIQTDDIGAESVVGWWGGCEECGRAAKKMRASGLDGVWSAGSACSECMGSVATGVEVAAVAEELSRDWEELLADISAAHAAYEASEVEAETEAGADRKRRHSAALRCRPVCPHPHARFVHCCPPTARPLTR